ncbi:MAG: metallophosphoesterase [Nanoarchaeota archaeon]|nr:metallophosphoesterase [Nanoarchaeota archaeon]
MVTKYGVIGDIHGTDTPLDELIDKITNDGVDAWILNGDIGDNKQIIYNTLKRMGETQKPVYVQPGSHETVLDYFDALTEIKKEYQNIVDIVTSDDQIFTKEDHDLLFLPGTNKGKQFIETDTAESGLYVFLGDEYVEISPSDIEKIREFGGLENDLVYVTNPNSLDEMLKDKNQSNTIAFNHVPSKFDKNTSVDYSHFYKLILLQPDEQGNLSNLQIGTVPLNHKEEVKNNGFKIIDNSEEEDNLNAQLQKAADLFRNDNCSLFAIESKENCGSKFLKEWYNKYNINKVISNHIPYASHNAHDIEENLIAENTNTSTLFYNPGCASDNKAGLLIVDGEKVNYKNIDLNQS